MPRAPRSSGRRPRSYMASGGRSSPSSPTKGPSALRRGQTEGRSLAGGEGREAPVSAAWGTNLVWERSERGTTNPRRTFTSIGSAETCLFRLACLVCLSRVEWNECVPAQSAV
jgi:hypothetical protein